MMNRYKWKNSSVFALWMVLAVVSTPALAGPDDDGGSVYNYNINWVVQTAPTEITAEVQAMFCPACNPNPLGNPGCTAFGPCFAGYGHQYCTEIYPAGTYIAVRVKDAAGAVLGMQKRVLQQGVDGFDVGMLSVWRFIFNGLPVNCGQTVTVEADTYCSWCGHWYPNPAAVNIIAADAKVTYTGDISALVGTQTHVSAVLLDAQTGEGLSGRTVTFKLNPAAPIATASAVTNMLGIASTTMFIPASTPIGVYTMDTRFAGDSTYFPCSDQDNILLRNCSAPAVDAGGSYSGRVGVPITFNGSASNDWDGTIISYFWEWHVDSRPAPSGLAVVSIDNGCAPNGMGVVMPDLFYEWFSGPLAQHAWHSAFGGLVRLNVMDNQGLTDWAYAWVDVMGPENIIQLTLKSHADLHVYDPQGRHVGFSARLGTIEKRVAGSSCEIFDEQGDSIPHSTPLPNAARQVITFPLCTAGRYEVKLAGAGDGPFELELIGRQDGEIVKQEVSVGRITDGTSVLLNMNAEFKANRLTIEHEPWPGQ